MSDCKLLCCKQPKSCLSIAACHQLCDSCNDAVATKAIGISAENSFGALEESDAAGYPGPVGEETDNNDMTQDSREDLAGLHQPMVCKPP